MSNFVEELTAEAIAIHNAPINHEISVKTNERNAVQAKYDTLADFKIKVQNHESGFHDVSVAKHSVLTSIDSLRNDCNACDIYLTGMDETFWMVANNKFPNFLFDPFYAHIDDKLGAYYRKIESLNNSINFLHGLLW